LAREAVDLGTARAAVKGVTLALNPGAPAPPVFADHDRMLQVLSNVIDNAIKFTPKEGRVEVSVDRCDDGEACFTVADTGPGIDAEELPHLFRPFWMSRARSLEGAGLGLMIARGIVEAHGGRIWAESELGEGSTFYMTIPAADTRPGAERRQGTVDRRRGPQERRAHPR